MDFSKGIENLKARIKVGRELEYKELALLGSEFKRMFEQYVKENKNLIRPLTLPNWGDETQSNPLWGFFCGYENLPSSGKSSSHNVFPIIYPFVKSSATAFEEESQNSYLIINFLIRAITSFELSESHVYMMDSNIGGAFNSFSPISTSINDFKSDKNFFHYITISDEKDRALKDIEMIIDKNIRGYSSQCNSVYEFNLSKKNVVVPYRFLFIRDICGCLNNDQINRLLMMVNSNTAAKAGVYVFYTYRKNDILDNNNPWQNQGVKQLIDKSLVFTTPTPLMSLENIVMEKPASAIDIQAVYKFVAEGSMKKVTTMTFDSKINKILDSGQLWQKTVKEKKYHLFIPVGYKGDESEQILDFNFKDGAPHAIIGGKTGTGKSVLINNIIVNAALVYSPEELRFYLADMKNGSGLGVYKDLPHVAVLSLSSDRQYVLSILKMVANEISVRNKMFAPYYVTLLDDYNELARKNNLPILPYKFLIIDEYQELVSKNDSITNEAKSAMEVIYKTGRSCGIFLGLSTQSFADVDTNLKQVGVKLSLANNEVDSVKVLGNNGAIMLRGVGKAILNNSVNGDPDANELFQVAYIEESKFLPTVVKKISEIYLKRNGGKDVHDHIVFDDKNLSTSLTCNPKMAIRSTIDKGIPIYIGSPHFCSKEHLKFQLHRQSESNILLVGNDVPSAARTVGCVFLQFLNIYPKSKVIVVDMQNTTAKTAGCYDFLNSRENVKVCSTHYLEQATREVYDIFKHRMDLSEVERDNLPELMLVLFDLRPIDSLNSNKSGGTLFNFGEAQDKTNSAYDMLSQLIKESYNAGIHIMIYSYNSQNFSSVFANEPSMQFFKEFETRIGFQGKDVCKTISGPGKDEYILMHGEGVAVLPKGQRYADGDHFFVYNSTGSNNLAGSDWDLLFNAIKEEEEEVEIIL